jgi:hypothetical protein
MENLTASALEMQLIPPDKWEEKAPEHVYKMAMEYSTGGPTGLGWNERIGWFMLGTGQGPYIAWMENPSCTE